MRFRKFIKKFDLFGHVIRLRFNGKGETRRTLLGGQTTIAVYGFMAMYFFILFF